MPFIKCGKKENPQHHFEKIMLDDFNLTPFYFCMYLHMCVDAEIKLGRINAKLQAGRACGGLGNGTVVASGTPSTMRMHWCIQ